jgi:sugar lactone lactonase YvrE
MRSILTVILIVALIALPLAPLGIADRPSLGLVKGLADVPPGLLGEGLAVDPTGAVYVGTINFVPGDGAIIKFDKSGELVDTIGIPGRPTVLGLVIARDGRLYAGATTGLDGSAQGAVVSVDPKSGQVSNVAEGFVFPNGLAFDNKGNLFVTDSFLGKVFKISPAGTVSVFASGPLLEGLPPESAFGANGLAFNKEGTTLYVANTAKGTIVKIEVLRDGSAGPQTVFASGIPSPDGVAFDVKNNLYVTANFANQIWVVTPDGSASNVGLDTSLESLENPASLAFRGRDLYITNTGFTSFVSDVAVVTVEYPGQPLAP